MGCPLPVSRSRWRDSRGETVRRTLPIWIFNSLFRPRQRPVTNVVAILVIAITFIPVLLAQILTRDPATSPRGPRGR
jgi:ABC-type spermidine/putrescine transport system permease subunit II